MEGKSKIDWRKIGHHIAYPHLAVIICLLPISIAFLVMSLIYLGTDSPIAILSYMLAFYVLLVICFRIPSLIKFLKTLKKENKYLQKWFSDVHLRVNVSLYGSLIWNVAFAIFQLCLGFYHQSFWYYSMFAYYVILASMRFFLLKHTRIYNTNEDTVAETKKYILCGWLLLTMNLALAVIIFFIVYLDKTFVHHMITTISLATYTFTTFTFAIVNLVRYKKYKSPVYSAAKNISLIAACVSMLTLETTMLTTFGSSDSPVLRQILLSSTGFVVIGFALAIAIIMIIKGYKKLDMLKETKNTL